MSSFKWITFLIIILSILNLITSSIVSNAVSYPNIKSKRSLSQNDFHEYDHDEEEEDMHDDDDKDMHEEEEEDTHDDDDKDMHDEEEEDMHDDDEHLHEEEEEDTHDDDHDDEHLHEEEENESGKITEHGWEELEANIKANYDLWSQEDLTEIIEHILECNNEMKEDVYYISEESLMERYALKNDNSLTQDEFEQAAQSIIFCLSSDECILKTTNDDDHHDDDDHDDHDDDDDDHDDNYVEIKCICALALFVIAIVGAFIPFSLSSTTNTKFWLSMLNCLSGGVFLMTGCSHLIVHVNESQEKVTTPNVEDYPLGMVIVAFSFILVFFFEHILFDVHNEHANEDVETDNGNSSKKGLFCGLFSNTAAIQHVILILLAISAHAVLESLVLGLEDSHNGVWLLFASIASHKGITAMALASRFLKANANLTQIIFYMAIFILIAPVSILLGLLAGDIPEKLNLVLFAISTGTFIYIGAYEIINEEFAASNANSVASSKTSKNSSEGQFSDQQQRIFKFIAFLAGAVLIALLEMLPESHDHGDEHNH